MRQGIQTFLAEAGEAACYALDILELAERATGRALDPATALQEAIDRGEIYYDWDDPGDDKNFFVLDPAKMLSSLTGRAWTVSKEGAGYAPKMGELVVQRWERVKTGQTIGHFRLPDWDSLLSSQTVRQGAVASLRVFR